MSDPISYIDFKCDIAGAVTQFSHFWEHTTGSGHATLALRVDWQKQLKRANKELGFKHVRFHGLLSDDMGTLVCENNQLIYSFFNADQVCDFLVDTGMKPFVELSFMPTTLSSGGDTVFHYKGNITPPKDYTAWEKLINNLAQHWIDRYGLQEVSQWFFEVWNEPNLSAFWKGTQEDYFKLYRHTAAAIKRVSPALKVGGPATAENEWIDEFTAFCEKENVPYDFITTHHYPTDSFGQPGDDTITQLSKSKRSVLREEAAQVKKKAKGRPVYYTEWCTSSNPFDDLHDMPYAAAFIVKTVMEAQGLVEGYSYWTFSDIFEENYFSSVPFHGGFGLVNIYGIPKPAYRAFELLHSLGSEQLTITGNHSTVDAWAVRGQNLVQVIITNWALPLHKIQTELVRIQLDNIPAVTAAYIEHIDEDHANARKKWEEMGRPGSLGREMVKELELCSQLEKQPLKVEQDQSALIIYTTMAPMSVACITIRTS